MSKSWVTTVKYSLSADGEKCDHENQFTMLLKKSRPELATVNK